jgi:hypothetical protein
MFCQGDTAAYRAWQHGLRSLSSCHSAFDQGWDPWHLYGLQARSPVLLSPATSDRQHSSCGPQLGLHARDRIPH